MGKGAQIAAGAALVVTLLGWYGASQIDQGGFAYYQTLEEFLDAETPGRAVRVHGYVAAGSIQRDVEGQRVRFRVRSTPPHAGGEAATELPVVYASLETPDLFKDGAEVVVEGRLPAEGAAFEATNLLAKCPSKFEGVEDTAALPATPAASPPAASR